jgi:short-subunit dehydrogenase
LAAQEVNLVLVARRADAMEKLAADLRAKYGVEVLVEPTDLAAPGAARRLKDSLDAKSVKIDILLNNAGYGLHGDFLETPIERTVDMIQLNVTTLTELTHLFGLDMAERGSGHIMLVASLLAFQSVPSFAAYAATKAYVLALGEALHDEFRPRGVVVTTLCPGHTATGFDAAAGATASSLLRLLTMQPRPVAETGARALMQGKAMAIPGMANNMAAFSNRLTPRFMQRATMKRILQA